MDKGTILLVEDNPDDVALTLRAFKKSNILNEVIVAQDGVEALDYLFATGDHAGRDTGMMPQLILLDLKLPKLDGMEVLRRMRAVTAIFANRWTLPSSAKRYGSWDCTG